MKLHLQTTIWTLLKTGSTQRQIERATGISRHTIRAYKKKFDSQSPRDLPVKLTADGRFSQLTFDTMFEGSKASESSAVRAFASPPIMRSGLGS